MPEQKIILIIDEQGAIMAKTSGFKGESCFEALDELLELQGVVSNVKKTDEYHEQRVLHSINIQTLKGKS
ncbi:DUF2997 domain-containing protein [Rheinheimera sp. UJ51]|uniref:DUF2997 domain-containing protein n=1 Tax=unclassified Rheinheimera TaxID=115860 RepID=UPI001E5885E9|nr:MULTISPECIES: DUF2997 domain-containing protein [unclassified Rheinheimera]MCC5452927.1 DUF2997 domain-containing protein [Rheinheimera sp. UJ51]MCF4010584.1 DUF2997 domain-containing protein [Rheinheimera sp. UJ63]